MATIDELKDAYLTTKHEASVVNGRAKAAKIVYFDMLEGTKLDELAAKGILIGATVVKLSHADPDKPGEMIDDGRFIVTGVKVVDDDRAVPIFAGVTKAGNLSKVPVELDDDIDYVIEVEQ